jgi:hypothetical protein
MAEKLASLRKKGGGNSVDPLVIFLRGSSYRHVWIRNEIVKQYKYMKLMTVQEYVDYMSPMDISAYQNILNTFSTNLLYNFLNPTTYQTTTLTTTAIDISTLNLVNDRACMFQNNGVGDGAYALKLYN